MEMGLQGTLRSLCSKTGWCYAVFWKLKRRSRMVLTWEDGFCEYKKPSVISSPFSTQVAHNSLLAGSCLDTGGNPLEQGICRQEGGCLEEQISLALAKMAYQVYSLGEGIVGRVAFTGKHQWVYSDRAKGSSYEGNYGSRLSSQNVLEKYPDGWQNQFAAGIKTIAVIAVLQGVVQLGSMEMIMEDLDWVDQVRSLFGSLQATPGIFRGNLVLEGQRLKGQPQSTGILPAGKSQSAPVGGSAVALPACPGQRSSKFVSGSTVNELECSLLGNIGSSNGSINLQELVPSINANNPRKIMVPESQLQRSFLQSSSCNNLKGTEAPSSNALLRPSGLEPLHAFTGLFQTNISTLGNQQLPALNTDVSNNTSKLTEQRLEEESRPTEQRVLFSNKIGNSQSQVHSDSLATDVQVNGAATQVADELVMRSHGSFRARFIPEALQHNSSSLSIEATACHDHSGSMSQSRFLRGLQFNQPLSQNMGCETHKPLVASNNACSKKSMVQVGPILTAPQNPTTDFNSSCLEDIIASLESPTSRVPFCLDNSILDHKCWEKELLNKASTNSTSQAAVQLLGQVKGDALELESKFSDVGNDGFNSVDTNMAYNCIATGEFDDPQKYVSSFTYRQDKNINSSFAIGDELSQALGPAFKKEDDKEFWKEILLQTSEKRMKESYDLSSFNSLNSTDWAQNEVVQSLGCSCSKHEPSSVMYSAESKSEPLLEAVVCASKMSQAAFHFVDKRHSCKDKLSRFDDGLSVVKSTNELEPTDKLFNVDTKHLFADFMQSAYPQDEIEHHYFGLVSDSQETASLQSSVKKKSTKAMLSSWIEDSQSVKLESMQHSQVKKPEEVLKVNRKRARPGESTRPRPKDRQQIQDRVRELREIIPNGSKCSIDALLEKTIKHMRFLWSVTQHANKLKQSGELKVSRTDESLLTEDGMESGASWALELGGQRTECPIIVENLSQPRQMRVEMLCEEKGLFLEIADIIRGLGLTIMKGIMESRVDKIWARFVVEANRDVHRIDILWSLMQLLQPNNKNGSSVSSQTVSKVASSMDTGSQAFCGYQQASVIPVHLKERLH